MKCFARIYPPQAERVKCFFAIAVSSDGKELIVYELPTKLNSANMGAGSALCHIQD